MPKQFDEFDDGFDVPAAPPAPPTNPLAQYFRVPGVHVRLPSQGRFMPAGSVQMTASGEVPVMPMRAADEMLMKSPDALLSGYAVERLIESCAPTIKNVKLLSTADIDVLLIAIHAATNGNKMDINATCPSCRAENAFSLDISQMLARIVDLKPEYAIRLEPTLTVYVKPHTLTNATRISLASFQEAKKIQAAQRNGDDAVSAQTAESYERLAKVNMSVVADAVYKVVVPDGPVTDRKFIAEFIGNISKRHVEKIEEALKDANSSGVAKNYDAVCRTCKHEWQADVEFNPTNFFA